MNASILAAFYAITTILAAVMYAWDKHRAARGGRRIRESHLHAIALIGGWPGAMLARKLLHHKTRQRRFGVILWCAAIAHTAAWTAFLTLRYR